MASTDLPENKPELPVLWLEISGLAGRHERSARGVSPYFVSRQLKSVIAEFSITQHNIKLSDKFAKRFHEREDYIVQLERQLDLLKHERDELADENARLKQKVGSSGDDRPPEIRLA
ncbi:hypothetical protein AAVH_30803 [Aphelenchoides avenae]|nr:hypothetical protein AAVH_30803 [Aphelenchus avenae]